MPRRRNKTGKLDSDEKKQVHTLNSEVHDFRKEFELRMGSRPKSQSRRFAAIDRRQLQDQMNSESWVRSVIDPFNYTASFPEPSGEISDTARLQNHSLISSSVDCSGSTDIVGGIVFQAGLKHYIYHVSAAVTKTNVTWSPIEHPKITSISDLVASYRTTSMGIRITNLAALLNMQGVLLVGRLPPTASNQAPPASLLTLLQFSDDVVAVPLSELNSDHLEVFWQPSTVQSTIGSAPHGASVSTLSQTALGYKAPGDHYTDSRLVAMWFITGGSTSTELAQINVSHVLNIQMLPHTEDEYVFDDRTVIGNPATAADVMSEGISRLKESAWDTVRTGVRNELAKTAHYLSGFAREQFARFAGGFVKGAMGSGGKTLALRAGREWKVTPSLSPVEEHKSNQPPNTRPPSPSLSVRSYIRC